MTDAASARRAGDASEQVAFEIRRYLSTRGLRPGERSAPSRSSQPSSA